VSFFGGFGLTVGSLLSPDVGLALLGSSKHGSTTGFSVVTEVVVVVHPGEVTAIGLPPPVQLSISDAKVTLDGSSDSVTVPSFIIPACRDIQSSVDMEFSRIQANDVSVSILLAIR
jgi:hypothetical protein